MQAMIVIAMILGIIYLPVETIVIVGGITVAGLIRHAVTMKRAADDKAVTRGAYEKLINPDYAKPRWFTAPVVIYAVIAAVIASLVYFY